MHDHLVIMTGHPDATSSLPRLVPVLSDSVADRLQRQLIEHSVAVGRAWRATRPDHTLSISCQGATVGQFREWLGDDLDFEADSGGSPGARMAVASVRAFTRGADRVVIMGVQCPDLDPVQIDRAFYSLEHIDCVIGPGHAGRYYLIGMVAPTPSIFAGIPWGTGAVVARTLAAVREKDLRLGMLPKLPMVHGPGDLVHAAHLVSVPVDLDPSNPI